MLIGKHAFHANGIYFSLIYFCIKQMKVVWQLTRSLARYNIKIVVRKLMQKTRIINEDYDYIILTPTVTIFILLLCC
jgi:hypothetical protein